MASLNIEQLIEKARIFRPSLNCERIQSAFEFVSKIYEGKNRLSGDPYIQHLLSVVEIMLPLKPDEDTLVACLLHGVLGDVPITVHKLREKFGPMVASMVQSIEMMKTVRPDIYTTDFENFRQMLLAIAKDLRVLLIRLADRLHNIKTLSFLPEDRQRVVALETLQVYAPLASRLGIYAFKWQLEDAAFRYLYPQPYKNFEEDLSEFGREKGNFIDQVVNTLKDFMDSKGIECEVEGRLKSVYSIYRKLKRKSRTSVRDIFDIFAIRVILPSKMQGERESVEHLYSVLGLIHSRWTPLANRFKDYIAVPKPNGYQSLHTTVIGLAPKVLSQPVEIQIRSERMHKEAKYGIASHWLYEDSRGASTQFQKDIFMDYLANKHSEVPDSKRLKTQVEWLRGLARLQQDLGEEEGVADALRLDLFNDCIFVLTPQGEVKDLPAGSTPVDFAYNVHTNIGHCCSMAKVNGKVVPLDHELKNGDMVEIILKPKPNPKPLWLTFVKTNVAKNKIKAWFRIQNRKLSFREGKELINRHLRRLHKPSLDESLSVLKSYGGKELSLKEREHLVESVGDGSLPANVFVHSLFSQEQISSSTLFRPVKTGVTRSLEERILLAGESGLPVRIAQCCSPREGQSILAYITRGQRASIHSNDCRVIDPKNQNRILQASWITAHEAISRYTVSILIECSDRIGLIRDITTVISNLSINISHFGYRERKKNLIAYAVNLQISSMDELDQLISRLQYVTGVLRVIQEDVGESARRGT